MSFWNKAADFAKKAGSAALNEVKEANNRNQEYKAEMPSKSDDELIRIVKADKNRTPLRSTAAYSELKSRGYDPETIKIMMD